MRCVLRISMALIRAKRAVLLSAALVAATCTVGLLHASEMSDNVATNGSLFELMAEIDELVHQNETEKAESRVKAATSDAALRSVLLARIQVLAKHREVKAAISRKIEQRQFGLRVARDLFTSMKLQPFLGAQHQVMEEVLSSHKDDFRVCIVVAATSIEHIVNSQRHVTRLFAVGATEELKEFINVSKSEFVSVKMNQLAADAMTLSQQLERDCSGTKVYTGIAMNSNGGAEGTPQILEGLCETSCFPFAVQFMLETLDSNGIPGNDDRYRQLLFALSQQGKTSDRIIAAAKLKYEDDYDSASTGMAIAASMGIRSEVFAERAERAQRMQRACDIIGATAKTINTAGEVKAQPNATEKSDSTR